MTAEAAGWTGTFRMICMKSANPFTSNMEPGQVMAAREAWFGYPMTHRRGKDILLYSQPGWKGGWRYQMTVWASFNGTATWPVRRLIDPGYSAYSSLAAGKDGTLYLLYEGGDKKLYDEVNIAVFNLKWLLEGNNY